MAQKPASRQRWLFCLYISLAVPCIIILLYFLNPAVQSKTNGYIQDFVGRPQESKSAAEEVAIESQPSLELPTVSVPESTTAAEAATEAAADAQKEIATSTTEKAQTFHTQSEASTGASRSPFPTSLTSLQASATSETAKPKPSDFNDDRWWFQEDLDPEVYPLPKFDIKNLSVLAPHNYRGLNKPTYATYFASRNATVHDPFFCSALQIVYRLLWDEHTKSEKHPVTVFVAPFVPLEQREYFAAAGALVREISLIPYTPKQVTFGRWRDMFSKLEMWRQLDFSMIAYMDSDAFPVNQTDSIFDIVHEQTCKPDLLPEEDKQFASTICTYALAGCLEAKGSFFQGMNAGVMVMKPNRAMYARLLREVYNPDPKYDTTYMEQGYLNWMYRQDGPFPFQAIPKAWNAPPSFHEEGKDNIIVHDKMWAHIFQDKDLWVGDDYKQRWAGMLKLFESDEFVRLRNEDQRQMLAEIN